MTGVGEDWVALVAMVLRPRFAVPVVVALVFAGLAAIQPTGLATAVFALLASVAAGIAGSAFDRMWCAWTNENVIQARGRSAIRGLEAQLRFSNSLRARIATCLERHIHVPLDDPETRYLLEELAGSHLQLAHLGLNAIEDWQDVVPEANMTTQKAKILKSLDTYESRREEVDRLRTELEQARDDAEGTQEELAGMRVELTESLCALSEARERIKVLARKNEAVFDTVGVTSPSMSEIVRRWMSYSEALRRDPLRDPAGMGASGCDPKIEVVTYDGSAPSRPELIDQEPTRYGPAADPARFSEPDRPGPS